ncbi:MAG: endonuclease/exonuclease/phosphatase family protein [Bacteroidales bacterium]|nr:endonuclease/exonuclease/phosphatase family protein [Bacteroidales bacterium]
MARAGNRKKNLLFGITSRALLCAAALLLLLSYVSVVVNPAEAWFMTFFGLFYIPFLLLNAFLLVWALARRSKAVLIPLVALLPSLFIFGRYFQFSSGGAEPGPDDVKVVSYNVGRFALSGERAQACRDSVVRFLREQDADIICLQEFFYDDASKVRAFFQKHFPEHDCEYFVYPTDAGCYGNVTLSRFPIRSKGKLDFDESSNLAIWSDCDVRGTRMRIYNCHFQSYNISLSRVARSFQGDYRKVFRDTEERMRASIVRRPRQVEMVLRDIDECPTEAVVTGDFNDNPLSYTYWRLRRGRKDTFVEAGKGFGATYSVLQPLLRIDYILYPEDAFRTVSHAVVRRPFSDHYPIVSTLSLTHEEDPR